MRKRLALWLFERTFGPRGLAEAIWDAREIDEPSGGFNPCDPGPDRTGEPDWWVDVTAEGRFPGSVKDTLDEANLVLDLLRGEHPK